MSEIKTFLFNQEGVEDIRAYKYGSNWPVVYIIEDGKELYVGETIRAFGRTKDHLKNEQRKNLKNIHVISDDEFHKSATLDTESSLIEYLVADGHYKLQNGNGGLQNHNYFDREKYQAKFEVLWRKLQKMSIAKSDLLQIRNSDLFKYSPYKTLTDEQFFIAGQLLESVKDEKQQSYVIHGGPGTGKTILATYILKRLVEEGEEDVALVIAMTSLRKTLKKVFRDIPGLKPAMVIGPGDVVKKKYNVLVVDEAHRLRQRKNIPNFGMFDKTNRGLGLGNEGTELDWIRMSAKKVILFYDENQSVRPSDIPAEKIKLIDPVEFELSTQMRVKGGEQYLSFIDSLLEVESAQKPDFDEYDFRLYDDIQKMVVDIKKREKEHKLSRMVAGYAWKWESRNNPTTPDIVIDRTELFWNSQTSDWVNSPNAINEVGCIHTIQGYDLNYTGIIIGPEVSFDVEKQEIIVDRTKYKDTNGYRGVTDPDELRRYVINIYKTLLTRGILGTYVYVVDETLRQYFNETINSTSKQVLKKKSIISPYIEDIKTVKVPLYDSIGCGDMMTADSTVHEFIEVDEKLMSKGSKYFVLRTAGDSMNERGVNEGDLVLCRKDYHPDDGNIVVALIGEDATLKKYHREKDTVVLSPCSTNAKHTEMRFYDGDDLKVQGVMVQVLESE
ncbi:MAG: DUF2075 family protein/DNA replication protein DnaC [bacterium]|jgi:DUF2075 family protein/DNA replication protein DnaC